MPETLYGYRILRSGNLNLLYRNGEIRRVCLGRIQVLNAMYGAVRDQNWTTIPFTTDQEKINEVPDGFAVEANLHYSQKKIQYHAEFSIQAKGNQLEVSYKGIAGSSFLRNRIGLCILHPIKECRGKPVTITHPDGSQTEGRFPELIRPDQPFQNISGMSWNPGNGISAELSFTGDLFELEDQRNWTDASYKTYCTPLEKPFPVKVQMGDRISQSVKLVVEYQEGSKGESGLSSSQSYPFTTLPDRAILQILRGRARPLPGVGTGRPAGASSLTREESELLSTLPFHHYHVDLRLNGAGWREVYNDTAMEQKQLEWPLELALHFGGDPGKELEAFLDGYREQPLKIRQLLVFDQNLLSPSALLKWVIPQLKRAVPGARVGGGTDAYFAELNRNPPDPQLLDFITYSICPQVHAFDNLTLVENLGALSDSVSSARSLFPKPVSIGAITLKQRFNAVATEKEDENREIPESDPRQHTPLAAAWTLGCLRNLALAGAASITCFETVGPRGILSRTASPATRSPLFHLFKEILTNGVTGFLPTQSSHPLEFDGMALQGENQIRLLVANFTETEKTLTIKGIPNTPRAIRRLGEKGWYRTGNENRRLPSVTLHSSEIIQITCPA
jgi:hypothetical protein